jgi:hypothetical protein
MDRCTSTLRTAGTGRWGWLGDWTDGRCRTAVTARLNNGGHSAAQQRRPSGKKQHQELRLHLERILLSRTRAPCSRSQELRSDGHGESARAATQELRPTRPAADQQANRHDLQITKEPTQAQNSATNPSEVGLHDGTLT